MTCTDTAPQEPGEPRPALDVPVRGPSGGFALRPVQRRGSSRCAVAVTRATTLTTPQHQR
ncbi:hypothetical protein [Kitasatospora sp. NPDC088346]|uniref:hypothetical protein n=1 Tax=Kitasatospora sp. NPDC088346 TaxID=3364073 RepID=UPI003824C432